MAETKPYKSSRWHWHSIQDRYNIRPSDWNKRTKFTLFTFVKYFLGPRYSFMQVLKILSVLLLVATCLFNLNLIMETNKEIENQQLILSLGRMSSPIIGFDENKYFGHLKQKGKDEYPDKFIIKVTSSKDLVDVIVNGKSVHRDSEPELGRGIHVVVLHESTANVMAQRVFDTYSPKQDEALVAFINSIPKNRILIFAVKDEASFQLQESTRQFLWELESKMIKDLGWRNTWAMVCSKQGKKFGEKLETTEDIQSWAPAVVLEVWVDPVVGQAHTCNWPHTAESQRRHNFCSQFDGYGELCSCNEPSPLTFHTEEMLPASHVPVAIIASNRPIYLYRMLVSLLSAKGANPENIVVFIDGHFEEPYQVAKLFNLKVYQHVPVGLGNARISQHYKSSLSAMFKLFPKVEEIIILEEDLDVSPDFFSYFSQTMYLLKEDSTLYCISAWNDQGYQHSSTDPSMLYRVETMPGLGWMLMRNLFENELEPNWPSQDKRWDWDMWMRTDVMRKGRECIIPDVSRTYHFGSVGVNVNYYFFDMYFEKHALNKKTDVKLKDVDTLKESSYERLMHSLVKDSKVLDHSITPCDKDFISDKSDRNSTYVAYFRMKNEGATDVFIDILRCLKLWDLEPRGLHRGAFRTFIKERHVIFIGFPASPYSLYKPANIEPLFIEHTENEAVVT